jgi:hypothetical protein
MNCKPGDLAVVVRSMAGNEGKIVRCVELVGDHKFNEPNGVVVTFSNTWRIDPPLIGWRGLQSKHAPDEVLRPIRDNNGEDEMLTWAGKPSDIKTPEAA